ncbi:MAG: T9SS type A sorting domain-containing protein [Sphingobacteriales bacterium]|nr:MAG: T9SS type A sorting domain-containing protein [Sphingobacteriales bacterium]
MMKRFTQIKLKSTVTALGILGLGLCSMKSIAQTNIASYSFTNGTSTYTPITGGTVFSTSYDDDASAAITMGGTFPFGGVNMTTCYINSNGAVTFGAASTSTTLMSTLSGTTGAIAAYGQDGASATVSGASPEIRYESTSTEFIIQFKDHANYYTRSVERMNFQIRLEYVTGIIKIVYGNCTIGGTATDGLTAQVGIRGNSTTYATNVNNLMIGNVPTGTTCNWSNAVTGNANSSTLLYSNSTNPNVNIPNGLTYTWTPGTQAPVRTFTATNGITTTGATINWTAPAGATQYNVRYRALNACNWTMASGNPYTGATAALTGLSSATTYMVQVQALNGSAQSIWSHIPNAAGTGNGYVNAGSFTTLATCLPATALSSNTVTNNGATIKWTRPTPAPVNGYQYYVSTSNTAPTTSTTPTGSVTDTFKVLTGLPAVTQHYVWVRSACVGTDVSAWTSSTSFTTLCVTPTPGATLSSGGAAACVNQPVTLSLANSTTGTGIAYLWQSSSDGTSYANITGATGTTYATTFTAPVYYRARVICSAGPDTVYSTPIQLNYANTIASTTPGQRCGVGTVNLSASGSGTATVRWFAAATGGQPLAVGNNLTTPPITATTDFYVAPYSLAPGTITAGTGNTTGTGAPYNMTNGTYGGMKTQYIISAADLVASGLSAGNINAIGLDFSAAGTTYQGFSVEMGTTALTEFPSPVSIIGGLTPVRAAANFTPVSGINTLTLSPSFSWDGVSNIIISTSWSNNNSSNTDGTIRYNTTATYTSQSYRKDNEPFASLATFTGATGAGTSTFDRSQSRPKFLFNGITICEGIRVPVTATVNTAPAFAVTDDKTVCNNGITTLSVNSTQASFNNVTWSPAANLYTNATATTPYVANTHAYTVYHKSGTAGTQEFIATANNTTTLCGAVDTVKLQVLPATTTAIANPGVLCVSGTSNLTLNPAIAQTGVQYQWQSSTNNITFNSITGATNATYTTPVITNTTYYRSVINNSDGQQCFNSVSDTVLVNTPSLTANTAGERCGPGTVALSAAASSGAQVQWFNNASGGAPVFTGANFTTPSISTSTTYYVSAATGSSGTAVLGAGSATSNAGAPDYSGVSPFAYHYGNYKHQMLITAAELNALGIFAGNINALGFDVASVGATPGVFNSFNIKLIPTNVTAMTATFITGGTNVYSATSVTPTVGINTYNFSAPFAWDGVSNLIVQTCYRNNNSGVVASSAEVKYDVTPFVAMSVLRVDGATTAVCDEPAGNASNDGPIISKRPKMIFGYNSLCESPRVPVTATIKTNPTAGITPSGNVSICDGQTQTLTATGGPSYTWLKNNVAVSGQTGSTFSATQADNYNVVVTGSNGCIDTSAVTTLTVNANPVVNIGADTAICQGASLTLNAGNSGASFAWSNGANTATTSVSAAGTYYVAVTNSNNCSAADTIVVTENPLPVVTLGNDTAICDGASLVLDAATGTATDTYIWDDQSTGNSRTITTGGSYHVTVTTVAGCAASDTIQVGISPLPVADNITVSGTSPQFSFGVSNGQNINSYSWDFGDNSPASSDPSVIHTYIPTSVTQTFVVTVIITNDCGSDTLSMNVTVSPVGIKNPQVNVSQLKLYPNPATQSVVLENVSGLRMKQITLFNVLGQEVLSLAVTNNSKQWINVNQLIPGMYQVRIECEEGVFTRKLEILK